MRGIDERFVGERQKLVVQRVVQVGAELVGADQPSEARTSGGRRRR